MRSRYWRVGLVVLLACGACGEELVVPFEKQQPGSDGGGPSQGVTGAGGSPGDEGPDVGKLPVAEHPVFTHFGGAEGEGGAGGEANGASHAGAASSGGVGGSGSGGAPAGGKGGTPSGGAAGAAGASMGHGAGNGGAGNGGAGNGGAGGSEGGGRGGSSHSDVRLRISEYLEGTGSLKALELHAPEARTLEGCELLTYFNGKTEGSSLALHGSIDANATYVLCSSALAGLEPERCDRSTNLTFNGDDAIALSCDGVLHDLFGQIGVDPGAAWGEGDTADHTLRRRCDATGPSDVSLPFVPSDQWLVLGPDLVDDLGVYPCPAAP